MIRLELDRVSKLCAATMLAVLAGCTGFGDRDPASPQPIRIGSGMWMVAARDDSTAVLIRHPVSAAEALVQGTQSADSAHTILYHSSGEVSEADIDSLILPVSDSTGGVAPAFAIVQADALRLAVIPGRSPALVQTPGKPDAHLFESVDGIWGIDADLLPGGGGHPILGDGSDLEPVRPDRRLRHESRGRLPTGARAIHLDHRSRNGR
jgi:hypothetical protein